MSFTLYGYERNTRSRVIRIVAAIEGIPLNLSEVVPRRNINRDSYVARFPRSRGKIPALEGPNIKLTETLAIVTYLVRIHNRGHLLGDGSPEQEAEILSWASWANQEFLQTAALWFLPLIPSFTIPPPYDKDSVAAGKKTTLEMVELLEDHLKDRDYLVGNSISIADVMVGIYLSRLFEWVLGQKWRDDHPAVMRFFDRFTSNEAVQQVIPRSDFILINEETPNESPATRQAVSATDLVA